MIFWGYTVGFKTFNIAAVFILWEYTNEEHTVKHTVTHWKVKWITLISFETLDSEFMWILPHPSSVQKQFKEHCLKCWPNTSIPHILFWSIISVFWIEPDGTRVRSQHCYFANPIYFLLHTFVFLLPMSKAQC